MEIEEAMARVASLDFTRLRRKLEAREGWSAESAAEAERLYRKFLGLMMVYQGRMLAPSPLIDEFWHAHILDTRAYMADCETLFGQYAHHAPGDGPDSDVLDAAIMRAAYTETRALFLKHFGIAL